MNILVTGGAGYIGSHTIIDILENTDWTPISVDDFRNSTPRTYDRIEQISGKRVKSYAIDLCDKEETRRIFKENDINAVIHFAAMKSVPESVRVPLTYYRNNLVSLMNVIDMLEEHKVNSLIFSSSCSVYGNQSDSRVHENSALGETECPYAESKVIGERILKDYSLSDTIINTIALRYFNPVGAHESGLNGELPIGVPDNLVPYITQTAAGIREKLTIFGDDYDTRDGTCIRDYIHVSDIAHAHVKAVELVSSSDYSKKYDVINLGTGKGVSVKECVEAFIASTGQELEFEYGPRRAGDVVAIYSDCKKSTEVLNWQAQRDLSEMMRSAWKWQENLQNQSL